LQPALGGDTHTDRQGLIELAYDYSTTEHKPESLQDSSHICITVDYAQAAWKRFLSSDYTCVPGTPDGNKAAVFVIDPDGYPISIIGQDLDPMRKTATRNDAYGPKLNHTSILVKNKERSMEFYQEVLGMSLKRVVQSNSTGAGGYMLGYSCADCTESMAPVSRLEGLLELRWKVGDGGTQHKGHLGGSTGPPGFGHIGISVDNIEGACNRFEKYGVHWQMRLDDSPFRIAFILDPDGYVSLVLKSFSLGKFLHSNTNCDEFSGWKLSKIPSTELRQNTTKPAGLSVWFMRD